jgi:hypothetical protein
VIAVCISVDLEAALDQIDDPVLGDVRSGVRPSPEHAVEEQRVFGNSDHWANRQRAMELR